ncbi:MAG: magnesium transporter CorA family protein [Chitinophagaceae bacterium]|nr:magnesium transporter CorA family protein [Chitinophagaceae bacterium]MBK9382335.1 magnesium transporter CorA family protein [Chitinophagaceae bacterium]MBL0306326.1 magnesium transporter CorA family protein [Chitinophagaceae bacterium]MBP6214893.1 magnesium transporter CorA family protein [Chitinophagaceae bacterium]HQV60302.1 magnesium transporter CorA family protein [Chitinophagaceae bacterium]
MIQYFKNINQQTVEIDKPEIGTWVNVLPPLKQEEFSELSTGLDIPIDFLTDSLDIDERSRFEEEDNVKLIVIKTPTENNSFNESDAYYITIPICIILTHNQILTVNSFDNPAIKKFLNTFQNRHPDKKNMMVLKVFEKVVQNYMDHLKEINQRRNIFEQKLYAASRNEHLLELMRIQKSLVYFVTAIRSNELLFMKLQRTNFLSLNEEEKEFLDDLIVDNSQALEMANIYSNILSSTLDAFAGIIANNQNEVLKRLSVITIVLTLPVLVASIYGMNVPIPYQESKLAFYMPVGLSLIISLFIGWFFLKKKIF